MMDAEKANLMGRVQAAISVLQDAGQLAVRLEAPREFGNLLLDAQNALVLAMNELTQVRGVKAA